MSITTIRPHRRAALTALSAAAVALACAAPTGAWAAPGAASAPTSAPTTTAPATSVGVARTPATSGARCATAWGTGAKGTLPVALGRDHLVGVRAGRQACFDRIVLDLDGALATRGYSVRYVRSVQEDGSGRTVALRGRAALQVVVGAPAYDTKGRETIKVPNRAEVVSTRGLRAVKQVAWAGSFEGQTTLGIGVDQRRPMRAFVLDGGTGGRLVIDVAHR